MANVTISPNMNLPIPTVGTDVGPDWANNLNACLSSIDSHNHTSGLGVQITPAGININAHLPFNGEPATQIGYVNLTGLSGGAPGLNTSVYSSDGIDLYFEDGNGNLVRLTQGGSIVGTAGSITGLPSGTASAAFSAASGTFVWQQATSTAANMDVGSIAIRYPGSYPTPSGNYIQIQAPSTLATGYALTLPAALPGSNGAFLTSATTGALGYTNIDNSTLAITSNVLGVKSQGITATQIADGTLTGTQLAFNINIPGTSAKAAGQNIVTSQTNATKGLAIIRGIVGSTGTILSGEGFTVTPLGSGAYTITYSNPFDDVPAVCVTGVTNTTVSWISNGGANSTVITNGATTNISFQFIAIGQR